MAWFVVMRPALVVAVACLLVLGAVVAHAQSPPNVLLIVGDDVGYGDLSSYGAPTIRTPNIDRLAREGTRFTQFYAAAPLCTPSRGSLLTGRLPTRLGFYTRFDPPADLLLRVFYPTSVGGLTANETTIASALADKGYLSGLVGKWHLGHVNCLPTQRGFNYFFGTPYSHDEGYPGPFPISLVFPPVPVYENERIVEQPIILETITPRMTEKALTLINTSVSTQRPFFLYMAYHEPHIPAFASPDFEGTSKGGAFGDMMEQMDASIGVLLNRLDELGVADNTLVLFMSDNGAWPDAREPGTTNTGHQGDGGSNGPFKEGKGSTWEGGMRSPLIARWPGHIPVDRTVLDIASNLDIFPTVLEAAGLPLPVDRTIDGKSLLPLLTGQTEQGPHDRFFYWRDRSLDAVRIGRYKGHFVTRPGFDNVPPVFHDPMLLFDLERDPGERFALNTTNYADVVAMLMEAAETHFATMEFGSPQFDVGGTIIGQSWQVIPCCSRQNLDVNYADPDPPEDWPLRLWKNCICPPQNATSPMPPSPLEHDVVYHGQSSVAFEKVFYDALQQLQESAPRQATPHRFVHRPQ